MTDPPAEELDAEPRPVLERFGRYELVAELASGGMASVYLARLPSEGDVARIVAVKRIHPHLARVPGFAEMFLDEARIAARIDHPNVCQVLEHGREGGVSFLAMEFLAGEPLQRVVGRAGKDAEGAAEDPRVTAMRMAWVIAEAADGLHAAHELRDPRGAPLGVVHRDVSPHNLFVTFDGTVKVVDFGIASAANQVHHTETGTVKGKFAYMAPEQLGGARADRRADVWALGVVLWEALTFKRLFRRDSPSEVVRAVESADIAPPSSVRAGVPAALDDVVLAALARSPSERTASAAELARALRAVLRTSGVAMDRAVIAEWMRELFPDGEARRHAWLRTGAEATPSGARARASRAADQAEPITREERSPVRPRPRPPEDRPPRARALALLLGGAALVAVGVGVRSMMVGPSDTEASLEPTTTPANTAPALPASAPPLAASSDEPSTAIGAPAEALRAADGSADTPPRSDPVPRARRASRPAGSPERTEPAPPVVPAGPATADGCITLGSNVRATIDGAEHEGPIARCIAVRPGSHTVSVLRADTGDLAYDRSIVLAPGERIALTIAGPRSR